MREQVGNLPFLREPPASTTQVSRLDQNLSPIEGSVVVETVQVPDYVIASVIVNRQAEEFLSPEYHSILSEEILTSWVRFTVPFQDSPFHDPTVNTSKKILTPREYGRSIPIAYGQIPYGKEGSKIMGGVIFSKGGGPSGDYYPLDDAHAINKYLLTDSPVGFYGDRDAKHELLGTNLLLENGNRWSLVLGYAVFSPSLLTDFIYEKYYEKQPSVAHQLARKLRQVEQNGNLPVSLIRLGAVPHRQLMLFMGHPSTGEPRASRITLSAVKRSMRLWREELLMPGSYLGSIPWVSESDGIEAFELFGKLSQGKRLDITESQLFLKILGTICFAEEKKLYDFIQKHPDYLYLAAERQFGLKDIDYALVRYDLERGGSGQEHHVTSYGLEYCLIERAMIFTKEYYYQLRNLGLVEASIDPWKSLDPVRREFMKKFSLWKLGD